MLPYALALELTPSIVSHLMTAIPDDRRDVPTYSGRYSPREIVGHLVDTEVIYSERIRIALREDAPVFGKVDMGEIAAARKPAPDDLSSFARLRQATVDLLRSLDEETLARTFSHAFGTMTILEFVTVLTGHDLYHLEQLSGVLEGEP